MIRQLIGLARENVRSRIDDHARRRAEQRGAIVPFIEQAREALERGAAGPRVVYAKPDHAHELVIFHRARAPRKEQ